VPKRRTGSYVFNLKISGCKSEIGVPFTLIKPFPFLTKARAVEVFYKEKKKMKKKNYYYF